MTKKFEIDFAFDIQKILNEIADVLDFDHVDVSKIVCMRSKGSTSKAYARIWSLERAWQKALNVEPHYIIEVVSPCFDKLPLEEQEKTLIHELLHIPKTFSGALVPHQCFDKRIDDKRVNKLYETYKKSKL